MVAVVVVMVVVGMVGVVVVVQCTEADFGEQMLPAYAQRRA